MPLVLPEAEGAASGRRSSRRCSTTCGARGFDAVGAHVDGRDERSARVRARHGFEEYDRQVEMVRVLDGESPSPPPFEGVEFTTIAERPELLEQAYELACEGYADLKLADRHRHRLARRVAAG